MELIQVDFTPLQRQKIHEIVQRRLMREKKKQAKLQERIRQLEAENAKLKGEIDNG